MLPPQCLPGSPRTALAPIPAPLPLPSRQERRFHGWLPWVTSAVQILPSEIAALIENRGSALSRQGLLRQDHGAWGRAQLELTDPHLSPKTSPQPRWPHSILTADVLGARAACPQNDLAQQRGHKAWEIVPKDGEGDGGTATLGKQWCTRCTRSNIQITGHPLGDPGGQQQSWEAYIPSGETVLSRGIV